MTQKTHCRCGLWNLLLWRLLSRGWTAVLGMFTAWFLWAARLTRSQPSLEVQLSFQNHVVLYFIYCILTGKTCGKQHRMHKYRNWLVAGVGWIHQSREHLHCPRGQTILPCESRLIFPGYSCSYDPFSFFKKKKEKASIAGSVCSEIQIIAFIEHLLYPCYCARHFAWLILFPPPQNHIQ